MSGKISETRDTPRGSVTTVRKVVQQFVPINASPDTRTSVSPPDITGNFAPGDAEYVVLSTDADLDNERVLTGTTNRVVITDNGAGSTVVLSTPQDLHTETEFEVKKLLWNTVNSLPSPAVLGQEIHLSTDNRLYYGKSPP